MNSTQRVVLAALLSVACIASISCANKSYLLRNPQAKIGKWRSIAILPCIGPNESYNQVATELLQMLMMKQSAYKVIEPRVVIAKRTERARSYEDGVFTEEEGVSLARKAKGDAVMHCTVTSHTDYGTMDAFVTLKLIDTQSGDIVASTHEPSGLITAWSVNQCVHAAAENAADNILKVLKDISTAER